MTRQTSAAGFVDSGGTSAAAPGKESLNRVQVVEANKIPNIRKEKKIRRHLRHKCKEPYFKNPRVEQIVVRRENLQEGRSTTWPGHIGAIV
jgi:hypothetical protein